MIFFASDFQWCHSMPGVARHCFCILGSVMIAESTPFGKEMLSLLTVYSLCNMSRLVRKPAFCICENKEADNCEADQRLCFRYIDSTIPLLFKSKISSL